MNDPVNSRPRFTLWQLLAAVTVIALLFGLLTPLVRRRQESARRVHCTSNLRQLALAVHTYHDTCNAFPPLATDEGHWSWLALTQQFLAQGVPSQIQLHQPASTPGNSAVVRQFAIPTFLCPERSQGRARNGGQFAGGQPTDYIAVSTTTALGWSSKSDGMLVFRLSPPTAANGAGLRSATTFGSVTDDSASTAMIGEKHMRADWLGGSYDEPALVATEDPNTIRVASHLLDRGLAQDRNDADPWKFGSWHGGGVQFAFADASVRSLRRDTDPKVLKALCSRNERIHWIQ